MVSTFSYPVVDGLVRKVQHITYSNGVQTERHFNKVTDTVPFDVIWVKPRMRTRKTRVKPSWVLVYAIGCAGLNPNATKAEKFVSVDDTLKSRLGLS